MQSEPAYLVPGTLSRLQNPVNPGNWRLRVPLIRDLVKQRSAGPGPAPVQNIAPRIILVTMRPSFAPRSTE
jgi:hypothetical protein